MALTDLLKSVLERLQAEKASREASRSATGTTAAADVPEVTAQAVDSAAAREEATRLLDAGNAAQGAGDLQEAERLYDAAIATAPRLPRAHLNRANVLLARDDLAGAFAGYATALELDPDYFAAHFNLGLAHLRAGNPREALACFDRVIALKPEFVDAHVARGNLLDDIGELDGAMASYRLALRLRPDFAEVHNNLGIALLRSGRVAEAVASAQRAVELGPDYAAAHGNLANALVAQGRVDAALAHFERALALDPEYVQAMSGRIFVHNYLADRPAAEALADARHYGALVARRARPATGWANAPDPERLLRIGFVSADLHDHPVGYFLDAVLAALRARTEGALELHAYAAGLHDDATARRLRAACHAWHVVAALPDDALAEAIARDGIDILIDLSGHTGRSRLPVFAWKPAPVQATWLGYFSTTGVAAIDYLIADPWAVPVGAEGEFTEIVWRLPETRLCFTPPAEAPEVAASPAAAGQPFTFGCFSHLTKVNDRVLALWARVLLAVPGSRLFLKAPQLAEARVAEAVQARLQALGIGAERLILEGPSPRAHYLAAYEDIDVMLDTFPYPGGTTTAEALWMGVPVLTLDGDTFLSRQGVSLLTNAGLADWVARDADDFVARAVARAGDVAALAQLRRGLRDQVGASPLFDAARFAGHFEAALRGMWRRYCEAPRPLA